MLQAFIQPFQDLRYVTTYITSGGPGGTASCHTFQRKYSRRYAAMSAAAAACPDPGSQDAGGMDSTAVLMAAGVEAELERRGAEAEQQMGTVDPVLKMQLRKHTAHLVR